MLPEQLFLTLPALLPEQDELQPPVPTVLGSIDYRTWRQRLERIDEILLQWFCRLSRLDPVRIPGKSQLPLYQEMVSESELREVVGSLMDSAAEKDSPLELEEPEVFLRRMNRLSMEMAKQGRRAGPRKARKKTLRAMKRQVANEEKILSLYEGHAAVYVRGKAGAEVEFGSQLLLAEAESGLITDWELVCGNPEHDTVLLKRSPERDRLYFTEPGTECGPHQHTWC